MSSGGESGFLCLVFNVNFLWHTKNLPASSSKRIPSFSAYVELLVLHSRHGIVLEHLRKEKIPKQPQCQMNSDRFYRCPFWGIYVRDCQVQTGALDKGVETHTFSPIMEITVPGFEEKATRLMVSRHSESSSSGLNVSK